MLRKLLLCSVLCVFFALSAAADSFVNGGFESGNFSGWTTGGGLWGYLSGPTNPVDYLPGGSKYNQSVFDARSAVVGVGTDPITGLSTVYSGNYSARINDSTPNYHVSVIQQTVANYTDPKIYFAWAAVLESAHSSSEASHFQLTLKDDTTNAIIYNQQYDSSSKPALFHSTYYGYSTWYYTDWIIAELDASNYQGDQLTLSLLASDCDQGGHGGYVYLDGFGAAPPPPGPAVPEPGSMALMGTGIAYLANRLRRRQ